MTRQPESRRLEAAFNAHHKAVLAYALRRVSIEADAEDVVAETFAVAWRHVDRLAEPDDALPWLLAIARRILANQRRSLTRRVSLALRLGREQRGRPLLAPPTGPAIEALARLRSDDQELLRLLAWEGLSQAEAAVVLGITPNAVAIRLHRARRRFNAELARLELKGSAPNRTSKGVEDRTPTRDARREPTP